MEELRSLRLVSGEMLGSLRQGSPSQTRGVVQMVSKGRWRLLVACAVVASLRLASVFVPPPAESKLQRRATLQALVSGSLLWVPQEPANAFKGFPNALQEALDYPIKATGLQPGEIGLEVRKISRKGQYSDEPLLARCKQEAVTSCFSTTPDTFNKASVGLLTRWQIPAGLTPQNATVQLKEIISSYPVGQGDIDKGGFRFILVQPTYIYVQFASVKSRISDVELAVMENGSVQVRTESRAINDEFGGMRRDRDKLSEAKRLNWITAKLREAGWTAPEITPSTHPRYFEGNQAAEQR